MDHAVSLVQAYLHVNGYFTVAEYPVLATLPDGGYQSATDVDLLGLRLCDAGGVVATRTGEADRPDFEPDPLLAVPKGTADLLVIEVKEGRAELNPGLRDPAVLRAVLERCGLLAHDRADRALRELVDAGKTRWAGDVWVRLVAFGSVVDPKVTRGFRAISLPHVTRFLTDFIERNWSALRHAQIRQQAFGFMALLEQVRRAAPNGPDASGALP